MLEEMEKIREKKVLDQGFVHLVDMMGDDSSIVQAARVSYGKGTKTLREDRGLIRYLIRHRHTTPFEMVQTKWHIKAPIFVARQWMRHRAASYNEYSLRYSEARDEFYFPEETRIQFQSKGNRQGSSAEPVPEDFQKTFQNNLDEICKKAYACYTSLNDLGLARELIRIFLPVNLYTEFYWSINLHNLMHFLELRMDSHAQAEIRAYGFATADILKERLPITWEAFEEYVLQGKRFSKQEWGILEKTIDREKLESFGENLEAAGLSKGEWREFLEKLQ
ncbi:MAG: FAD-dependent thymidylate synthase [Firmicutes bacterium]|jgi:thymidylate synthase (FAD)|nr:FAD-dependent thymidylate synthase [Bacillota bacterium]